MKSTTKLGTHSRDLETLVIVTLGVLGFLGAPLVVTGGSVADNLKLMLFDSAGAISMVWLLIIGVQGALWAICAPIIVLMYCALGRKLPVGIGTLTVRVFIPICLMAGALLLVGTRIEFESWWTPGKVYLFRTPNLAAFGCLGLLVAISAVAGMLYAGAKATALASTNQDLSSKISSYLRIHSLLDGYLLIASIVLALGVLASSALRATMNAEHGDGSFPQEWIMLYGGVYSLLLGIAYTAARIGALRCGHTIYDSLSSDPPDTAVELTAWTKTDVELRQSLRLRFTEISTLGDTFAVLAPLLIGLVSGLL